MFRIHTIIIIIPLFFVSCGKHEEIHEKSYLLYFDTQSPKVLEESKRLVKRFNLRAGFTALRVVDRPQDANSTVVFRSGILEKDNHLGYGQWMTETKTDSPFRRFQGKSVQKKVFYSMALEFDKDFFERLAGGKASDPEYQRLDILFLHEVGHGMQLEHSDDRTDVMYEAIHDSKRVSTYNIDRYFKKIRNFYGLN